VGKVHELERRQALVMIHAHQRVIGASYPLRGLAKQAVGSPWPAHLQATTPRRTDRRGDHARLLVAEKAVLAGVGIESSDRDTWRRNPKPAAQSLGGQHDRLANALDRQSAWHLR